MSPSIERLKEIAGAHRRLVFFASVGLFFVSFYVVLKVQAQDEDRRLIFRREEIDLSKTRVLGEPSEEVLKGKAQRLDKNASDLIETNKALLTRLSELEAKVKQISPQEAPAKPAPGEQAVGVDASQALGSASAVEGAAPAQDGPTQALSAPVRFSKNPNRFESRIVGGPRHKARALSAPQGPGVVNFPVARDKEEDELATTLPSGSFVKGVVLTGVDAHQEEWPVLIQLDFAFVGPNKSSIDLSGCFVIAKARGDLSIERVIMQTEKLSCVSESGEMFERQVNGWVADDADNKFGVSGPVNGKRGRVLSAAFLASLVEGIGKAVQMSESTTQVTALGGSQSAVSGDRGAYLAGGAAATAASKVADWYLKQAENLLPSITVGSGRRVWITVKDKVHLPVAFFRPTMNQEVSDEKPHLLGRFN
jgi:conjugal transfer pilus assembly protein TraB